MDAIYSDPEHWSSASIMPIGTEGTFAILAEIVVHRTFRGQGWGTRLLNAVCEAADDEGITLLLSVQPDHSPGSLNESELLQWYQRHGFVTTEHPGMMQRDPQ